jgi:hypothetical protein
MKGCGVMVKRLKFIGILLAVLLVAEPALAQYKPRVNAPRILLKRQLPNIVKPPLASLGMNIKPSQAAAIALSVYPDAKVVKVKLRADGVYAVTLRTDSSVEKVFVSGEDGSIL